MTVGVGGKLSGISTQSDSTGTATLNTLCGFFRNGLVGVAQDSAITGAVGTITHDGGGHNPHHATVNNLTGAEAEGIFTPTIANPNRRTN